jgi:hypothetical protein
MKTLPSFLVALALTMLAGVAATGCTPEVRFAPIRHTPIWHDNGTPAANIALEREMRYYRDEAGTVWDDRGRKVEAGS